MRSLALLLFTGILAAQPIPRWTHLSSTAGDLPSPGPSDQQTGSLACDIDNDGDEDFFVAARVVGPAVTLFHRGAGGWAKHVPEPDFLRIEAGGACHDIDGDGDRDIVFGADAGDNHIWWWENPFPEFAPDKRWNRLVIKASGSNKHHDQIFGDFDGDGRVELVAWNQRANALLLYKIPADPKAGSEWTPTVIYEWTGEEHEGVSAADVNGDGVTDLVGGGRWFEHAGGGRFEAHVIDDQFRFSRAGAGQFVEGGRPEVVFAPGDVNGPIRWYEWKGDKWVGHDLPNNELIHGHSIGVGDVNGDGHDDILSAEMGQWGRQMGRRNFDGRLRVYYGDGKGEFVEQVVSRGFGNHETRLADLDGDGDLDILAKPYNWRTPRIDAWINESPAKEKLALDRWRRHVIDDAKPWRAVFILPGDLDGDGKPDLAAGGWWYRNPGSAGGRWERRDLGLPLRNVAAVHDFDEDGDLDVLGTEGEGSSRNPSFVWARNDGKGSFDILRNVPRAEGDFLQGVAVGRFFEEHRRPSVALSWHHDGVGVQMLTPSASPSDDLWTWKRISPFTQDEQLSIADIDRDGDADLWTGTHWLRNDDGHFIDVLANPAEGLPDRNRLADINGDGRLDAVVGYESSREPGKLAWYEQPMRAEAEWAEHVIAQIIGPMSMDVADLDLDGDVDVVLGQHNLADPAASELLIFENADGRGGEWARYSASKGDEHHDGSQVVDVDGDGDLDIVSLGWTHGRVLVYENLAR
jgi:hypothetical protein